MNGLFGQVKNEVEEAKKILSDIRSTLRNDGPDQAKAKKKMTLDGDQNPILNARKLLEQEILNSAFLLALFQLANEKRRRLFKILKRWRKSLRINLEKKN